MTTEPLPYFRFDLRVSALQAQAARWLGTPFRVGSAAPGPGGGVDCVRLAEALLAESGATPRFRFPHSTVHRTSLDQESPFAAWLEGRVDDPQSAVLAGIFRRVAAPARAGDLLLISAGRYFHLVVAVSDTEFANCLQGVGVFLSRLDDPTYADRIEAIYRPFEAAPGEAVMT